MPLPPKPPPFLDDTPPPWLARALATSALVVAGLAVVAGFVIKVPETVTGRFMLVPARGTDPVRAPQEGVVTRVAVNPATAVHPGDTLFVVASDPAIERNADRGALERTVAQGPVSRRDLASQFDGVRKADAGERVRLDARIGTLQRSIAAKRDQSRISRDLEERGRKGAASGVTSEADLASLRINVSRLEDDIAVAEGTLADTRAARSRLDFDAQVHEADYRDRVRKLDIEIGRAESRLGSMRATGATTGTGLVVRSPCEGTLLRLNVRAPGAYVTQGALLADLACSTDSLVVEVEVPASGIGRVRAGQDVRLLYDAFPYQRYGVRFGELTWVGASSGAASLGDSTGFRARARADDKTVRVDGADRALMPGMGGIARVVVEKRRLITYAFAPIIQLREAMSDRKKR